MLLLEHLTALFGLSTQLSNLSTDCDELERLACVSPVCSLADNDLSMNIPESELTATGLLSDVTSSALSAKHKNLEVTVDKSLTSDEAEAELATCCGCDHGIDNAADSGSIRQSLCLGKQYTIYKAKPCNRP